MKPSILIKLENLSERFDEIAGLLAEPDIINDQNQFRKLSVEYSQLEPITDEFRQWQIALEDQKGAQDMLADPEMKEMAQEEIKETQARIETLELTLQKLLLPTDPNDERNVFLEIRAGTGGSEAAIFAGDLFKMYSRFAESQRWTVEMISQNEGEHGGYKEVICNISGNHVYSRLKFESGVHRVQRVPDTESQGRVHTSAATVAIMPEPDEIEAEEINSADLRVDTFRASGAGGQHVNKTDSAIRITHLPSGLVVECQDERSQHKNRAKAMAVLQARLLNGQRQKQQEEQASTRRDLVGSGDRSERIRTYNYPQGRITDHRINLTLYKLDEILQGDLSQVVGPLVQEYQTDQLTALSEE